MIALVVGGASSGKSAYAEQLACALGADARRIYVATMENAGAEAHARVERHRSLRAGKRFETFECACRLDVVELPAGLGECVVLVEDVGNLAANELFGSYPEPLDAEAAYTHMIAGLQRVAEASAHLVVVGNLIDADGATHAPETAAYIQLVGRVQCAFAQRCDAVIECTAGVPQAVKGTLVL